jgi:hypothetical protein
MLGLVYLLFTLFGVGVGVGVGVDLGIGVGVGIWQPDGLRRGLRRAGALFVARGVLAPPVGAGGGNAVARRRARRPRCHASDRVGGGDVAAVDADAELTPGADLRLTLPIVSLSQQAR